MHSAENGTIKENDYKQILIWPFILDWETSGNIPRKRVKKQVNYLKDLKESPWKLIDDKLHHIKGQDKNQSELEKQYEYQEFVYFHNFVSQFLFEKSGVSDGCLPALNIFKREDIRFAEVVLAKGEKAVKLSVDRINLYFFDIGVAVLVVELSNQEKLGMNDVMSISNQLRRVYPPYWEGDVASQFPKDVKWLKNICPKAEKKNPLNSSKDQKTDYIDHVNAQRYAPVAPHWRGLLEPLSFESYVKTLSGKDVDKCLSGWRQIVDERIPNMAYIGTAKIKDITKGDWIRLCCVDMPDGSGAGTLPYGSKFLESFEENHMYDRFWFPENGKGTRYLCAGYSFLAVASPENNFADKIKTVHFRRQYFQIGLIVHLQMAALLAISGYLSDVVRNFHKQPEKGKENNGFDVLENSISKLREEFLRFTHCYWFTGVSNQVQGQEIYDLWRKNLNMQVLYDEVANELKEADNFLTLKRQEDIADETRNLTWLAALGLPIALAVGFLGMNLVVGNNGEPSDWSSLNQWFQLFLVFAVFSGISTITIGSLYFRQQQENSSFIHKVQKILYQWCVKTLVILTSVFLAIAFFLLFWPHLPHLIEFGYMVLSKVWGWLLGIGSHLKWL